MTSNETNMEEAPGFDHWTFNNSLGLTALNHSSNVLILNKWLNELTCLSAVGLDLQVGQQPNQMKITIVADGDRMLALI